MNELAGQSLGGYYLEEEIGRGSMGVVYRGKQIALDREVAIKVLPQSLARDASYKARFIREAQIIAGLNHPNIVQIYDAGQLNKLLYFVMEYVQGPTLASLVHLDGIITQHLAVEYVAQIADALHAAYSERNVIHRDIKPENLMLNRWGKMKVMDFGLARAVGLQRITVAKTLVGSLYYASPEQIWGETLDNRSDIYALGVVLYEMVTGRRPFNGRTMAELTEAILSDEPRVPHLLNPDISPELEQILWKALAKDRHQRYEDAGLMAQSLRALSLRQPEDIQLSGAIDRIGSYTGTYQSSSAPFRLHNRMIMQLPKRPQVQLPTRDVNSRAIQQQSASIRSFAPSMLASQSNHLDEQTQVLKALPAHEEQPSQPEQPPAAEMRAVQIWTPPDRRSPWHLVTEWLKRLRR